MNLEIILSVLINLVLVAILVCGAIVGKKNGIKLEFLKLILVCGDFVGTYFLAPIVKDLLFKIEFLNKFMVGIEDKVIASLVFCVVFILIYVVICLICLVVKKLTLFNKIMGINGAKRSKIVGTSKKETKELRKEYKQSRKELKTKKELRTTSKIFGIIFGIILASIICLALMLPVKYITKDLSERASVEYVNKCYENTLIGQTDKFLDYSDKIIK